MAVDAKIGIVKLQISQATPTPKPNANNPVSILALGSDGSIRTLVNTAISNTPQPLDKIFEPAIFRYNFPTLASALPQKIVFELTLQLDGEFKKFYFSISVTRDEAARADTFTLDNPNQDISDGAATIRIAGISWIQGITSNAITMPWFRQEVTIKLVCVIASSPLVGSACGDALVFGNDNDCGCEPICQLLPITNFINCNVPLPPQPPPIENCGLPPEPPEPIVNPVPPGTPGEPGDPPEPGDQGPPGDPGPPGGDGCTPQIYWSSSTVTTTDCTIPFSMDVFPIGECSYWVSLTFYRCYSDYYYGDHCCDFIYCGGTWVPLYAHGPCLDIEPPSYGGEDGEIKRRCQCEPMSTTTTACLTKLWTARIDIAQLEQLQELYPGVVVTGRTSINPNYVYVAICADNAPTYPWMEWWYNKTSAGLAAHLSDPNFLQLLPDPICCIATPVDEH